MPLNRRLINKANRGNRTIGGMKQKGARAADGGEKERKRVFDARESSWLKVLSLFLFPLFRDSISNYLARTREERAGAPRRRHFDTYDYLFFFGPDIITSIVLSSYTPTGKPFNSRSLSFHLKSLRNSPRS